MILSDIGFIRPTLMERAAGRLMRAPDHDAGTGDGGDAGGGDGGDSAGKDGSGADSDAGGDGADDATVLGSAKADDGAGDGKDGDDKDGKDAAGDKAKADGKSDAKADTKDDGPPETYELKLTTTDAEGKESEVELDSALVEAATPVLKEAGLNNEQANKLMPLVPKIQERLIQQQNDAFAATRADWAREAEADKDIGGKNWKETNALAAKALDRFVGPAVTEDDKGNKTPNAFRQLLDDSGLGNHPVMIRAWRDIGRAIAEDGVLVRSDGGGQSKKSREEVMYPDDAPKK